jgi:signal transduction histidine kinase
MEFIKTKSRLFVKIYLSFWLATIIMIVALFVFDRMTDSGLIQHLRYITGHALSLHGKTAIDIFEREGIPSLNNYLSYVEDGTGLKIFIFDISGNEIRGQKAPPKMANFLSSHGNTDLKGDNDFVVQEVPSSKMKKYIIAAEVTLRSPPLLPPNITTNRHHILPPPNYRLPPPPPLRWTFEPRPGPPPPFMPFPDTVNLLSLLSRILIALTLSGAICYLLAHYLTAPIAKLRNATRLFADGNLSIRVSTAMGRRNDEISWLALDFDLMAERIELLLTSQRTLLRDVSHELRSPLARLNVALELCRRHGNSETEKYLDRIGLEADKLNELIGQILTLNRVESGITQLKKEQVNIGHLINEIVLDADFEAKNRNRSVSVAIHEECTVLGSVELIRRAIENIVRNAILYTAERSTVEISVNRILKDNRTFVLIIVRDFGAGISEEELENIFKPFYRVGEGRDRLTGGAGIGLTIADVAVRLHGGSIKAINAPGSGLRVEILLPIE